MRSRIRLFLLIAPSAILLWILVWQARSNSAEKFRLQDRIGALSHELVALESRSQQVAPQPPSAVQAPAPTPRPVAETNSRKDPALLKLQESLAAARSQISELESKALSLEADRATLTQQRQQELAASDEACRTRIAGFERSLESAQGDLKAAQQRSTLFESENANLRKAQPQAAKPPARSDGIGELDELSRHRDTYLKTLIRRYHEIDTEYRAMLNSLDTRRDPQSSHPNDAAVFRIQTTLSQAEDDLRQIDSLNAKTLLVEKRLEKN